MDTRYPTSGEKKTRRTTSEMILLGESIDSKVYMLGKSLIYEIKFDDLYSNFDFMNKLYLPNIYNDHSHLPVSSRG